MIIIFHFKSQPNALSRPPPSATCVSHLLGPRIATMMVVREAPKRFLWRSIAAVVGVNLLTELVLLTRSLDLDSGNKPTTQHFALLVVAACMVSCDVVFFPS